MGGSKKEEKRQKKGQGLRQGKWCGRGKRWGCKKKREGQKKVIKKERNLPIFRGVYKYHIVAKHRDAWLVFVFLSIMFHYKAETLI
jgi:hypothetical protein